MVQQYLEDADEQEDNERRMIEDYQEFKRKIRIIFGTFNEESQAIRIIQYLQQKKSASEYAAAF